MLSHGALPLSRGLPPHSLLSAKLGCSFQLCPYLAYQTYNRVTTQEYTETHYIMSFNDLERGQSSQPLLRNSVTGAQIANPVVNPLMSSRRGPNVHLAERVGINTDLQGAEQCAGNPAASGQIGGSGRWTSSQDESVSETWHVDHRPLWFQSTTCLPIHEAARVER